jgi:hypothetical protein
MAVGLGSNGPMRKRPHPMTEVRGVLYYRLFMLKLSNAYTYHSIGGFSLTPLPSLVPQKVLRWQG